MREQPKPFNDRRVVVQSWYVAALSRELPPGRAVSRDLLGRRVALYRGRDGKVRALEARCPHLGADLGRGRVMGDRLRCEFHHWSFDGTGACVDIPCGDRVPPGARTFSYPVEERWGAIWIFNGPRPLFELPSFERWRDEELFVSRLPPQALRCHPHVLAGNGLDVQHFRAVHGFKFAAPPELSEPDPWRVRLKLELSVAGQDRLERALRLLSGSPIRAAFTTWGGNLATIEGSIGPIPLLVLFSHRPSEDGGSESRTFFLAPRARGWRRALGLDRMGLLAAQAIMAYMLMDDRKVLEAARFQPRLTESDAALAAFIRQVNGMPTFSPDAAEPCPAALAEDRIESIQDRGGRT